MGSKKHRILMSLVGVLTGALLGALTLFGKPVAGAVAGAIASSLVAAGLLITPKPSKSARIFAAIHEWSVSADSDAVAIEALAGRVISGVGRSAMEGAWRGRRAARFQVRLSEGATGKDIWIEGVFLDGQMPAVDLLPKGNRRLRKRNPEAHKFGRAWKVFTMDKDFATALLHDEMRIRLLSAPTPRNWVFVGAGFIGVRYEAFAPNCKGTPARLDFVSDLADLVPRAAWDALRGRWSGGGPLVQPVVAREQYLTAYVSSPAQSPLKVSARSAQSDSSRRIALTVGAVFALGTVAMYLTSLATGH